jgi:hypothetical protein
MNKSWGKGRVTHPGEVKRLGCVQLPPEDIARNPCKPDGPPGDCYLLDMTYHHSPIVVCCGIPLGTAVRFGGD